MLNMSVLFCCAVVWLDPHLMVFHFGDYLFCSFHPFWEESGVHLWDVFANYPLFHYHNDCQSSEDLVFLGQGGEWKVMPLPYSG